MEQSSTTRILMILDKYLEKKDYDGAEKHLLHWLQEAYNANDDRMQLLLLNELIGLYRKLNNESYCLQTIRNALNTVHKMEITENIGVGTTYINCATAYQAFNRPEQALPLFENALKIYEKGLSSDDKRRGGLYNNMALTLISLKRFSEAYEYYNKAIEIMLKQNLPLEIAITYLNIASAKEIELGLDLAEDEINVLMDKAATLLDTYEHRQGYYAFVCEKCASVFGYYGRFMYKNTLLKRAKEIYART